MGEKVRRRNAQFRPKPLLDVAFSAARTQSRTVGAAARAERYSGFEGGGRPIADASVRIRSGGEENDHVAAYRRPQQEGEKECELVGSAGVHRNGLHGLFSLKNRAPFFVLGDRHSTLPANPDSFDRLITSEELLDEGHFCLQNPGYRDRRCLCARFVGSP